MTSTSDGGPRWFLRALPVTALALLVLALASLVSPGFRHQLAVSTTHEPQQYVELYFTRTSAGTPAVCTREGGSVRVRFAVTSHLSEPRRLDYETSVAGASQSGSATVDPGRTVTVDRTFVGAHPDAYEVSVSLPGLDQQLRAHCDGSSR